MKPQPGKLAAWAIVAAIIALCLLVITWSLDLAVETVRGWL